MQSFCAKISDFLTNDPPIHRTIYLKSVYLTVHMATKTISIIEEVYEELIRQKKAGESFSDEIMRLSQKKGKISECSGLWSWMELAEIDSIRANIEKRRKMSAAAKKEKKLVK